LFVIIKLDLSPNFLQNIAPSSSRNDVDQENEDLMEENDGTNQIIQGLFAQTDEDGDSDGIYD
jgi:hypothetical protein